MKSVVIYGAGSPIVVDIEESCHRSGLHIKAIVNNVAGEIYAEDKSVVIEASQVTEELFELSATIPLFTPAHRKFAYDQAKSLGFRRFDPLIDPTSIIPRTLTAAEGVYINSGVTIGAMAQLGAFVFINRSASLGHHFVAEEFSSIGPGVITGGNVNVGRGAVIGVGAVILPGIRIGNNSVVGGGAVVTKDVPENTLVAGNPAVVKKEHIAGYHGKGL